MTESLHKNTVSLEKRQAMIRAFPCFASLSEAQTMELAELMQEINIKAHERVVTENELVDSIYLIVSGEAEVTKEQLKRKRRINVPVAALRAMEGIGLNDTGFYSTTGKRTASVTALTDMLLLRLDLKDLYAFLKHNHLELSMYAASMQMLRMRFIKQSLPFAHLSHERLQWLADHVEELNVPKDTILFKQGDEGNKCYLIRSGKIEIINEDEDHHEKKLAVLRPPTLFGEATLITHTPRNATAKALEDCELLVINHAHLSELLESEENVADMFMTLMVDRSRPTQNPRVSIHHRHTADGQAITIVKNPDNGSYFKLSEQGIFIWNQLDGKHTLQEITLALAEQFKVFSPDIVVALISKLARAGLIENLNNQNEYQHQLPLYRRVIDKVVEWTNKRIAFGDADKWITHVYHRYIKWLFTIPAYFIFTLIAMIGLIAFSMNTEAILIFFSIKHVSIFLLLGLYPLGLIRVVLHELGHAFTVKYFGREVHYMGVGMYGVSPIAFTDTSDMWLADRKPRIMVNLAGVCVDAVLAGISAIMIFFVANYYVKGMLWLFTLYTYLRMLTYLNPTQEMDGYYALMDWTEKSNLRHAAVRWLVKKFPKAIRKPKLFKENKPEITYWLACLLFLLTVTVVTYIVQIFIFKVIGIASSNLYLTLALPFIAAIFSSLGIFAEIRKQEE